MSINLKSFTVNVNGDKRKEAEARGLHAYYSDHTGITAIEIKCESKRQARTIISKFAKVLYIFE